MSAVLRAPRVSCGSRWRCARPGFCQQCAQRGAVGQQRSQQDEQPGAGPAPAEKKRKCSHSGEFRAGSGLLNPRLRPEGPLGLDSQRGAQEGR